MGQRLLVDPKSQLTKGPIDRAATRDWDFVWNLFGTTPFVQERILSTAKCPRCWRLYLYQRFCIVESQHGLEPEIDESSRDAPAKLPQGWNNPPTVLNKLSGWKRLRGGGKECTAGTNRVRTIPGTMHVGSYRK